MFSETPVLHVPLFVRSQRNLLFNFPFTTSSYQNKQRTLLMQLGSMFVNFVRELQTLLLDDICLLLRRDLRVSAIARVAPNDCIRVPRGTSVGDFSGASAFPFKSHDADSETTNKQTSTIQRSASLMHRSWDTRVYCPACRRDSAVKPLSVSSSHPSKVVYLCDTCVQSSGNLKHKVLGERTTEDT